jgi:hypothetical protein
MPAYSAEQVAEIARVRRVKEAHEDDLLDLPGVNAVGLSLKIVNGVRIPQFALIVHVTQKKPLDELPPGERIPPEIDGVPTDVVVDGPFVALTATVPDDADDSRYRPIIGGSVITPDGRDGVGTLGCVVVSTDPAITDPGKQFLLLTNSHVLFKPPAVTHTGAKVGQPDTCSICSVCMDHAVAHLDHDSVLSGYPPSGTPTSGPWLDAGVATLCKYCRAVTLLEPATTWVAAVIKSGEGSGSITTEPIAGTHPMTDADALFDSNQQHIYGAHKRGAKTRDTQGWVDCIHLTADITYQDDPSDFPLTLRFKEQIKIVPKPGIAAFAAHADSGSVVLNDQSQVIGLVFGGNLTAGTGFAAPIADVETQLKVRVADAATYPGKQTVPQLAAASVMAEAPQPAGVLAQRFAEAESALRATPAGDFLAETVRRHVPEVRTLVNTNRRVLVLWQRMQGPRWLGQGLQWLVTPGQAFPADLAGLRFADCVAAFAQAVQEYGSAALASDAAWLGRLLPEFADRSYADALALLRFKDGTAGPVTLASEG